VVGRKRRTFESPSLSATAFETEPAGT